MILRLTDDQVSGLRSELRELMPQGSAYTRLGDLLLMLEQPESGMSVARLSARESRELIAVAHDAQESLGALGQRHSVAVEYLRKVAGLKNQRHAGDPDQPSLGLAIRYADEALELLGVGQEATP